MFYRFADRGYHARRKQLHTIYSHRRIYWSSYSINNTYHNNTTNYNLCQVSCYNIWDDFDMHDTCIMSCTVGNLKMKGIMKLVLVEELPTQCNRVYSLGNI